MHVDATVAPYISLSGGPCAAVLRGLLDSLAKIIGVANLLREWVSRGAGLLLFCSEFEPKLTFYPNVLEM